MTSPSAGPTRDELIDALGRFAAQVLTYEELMRVVDRLLFASFADAQRDVKHEVRFDDGQSEPDGTIDEVVGVGQYHAEMMDDRTLWVQLGPDAFAVYAKRGRLHFRRHGPAGDFASSPSGRTP